MIDTSFGAMRTGVFVIGAGLAIATGSAPGLAQDGLSWHFSEDGNANVTLSYDVPETDNVAFRAVCVRGSGVITSHFYGLPMNSRRERARYAGGIRLFTGHKPLGTSALIPAGTYRAIRTSALFEGDRSFYAKTRTTPGDAVWAALRRTGYLVVVDKNYALPLAGAGFASGKFVSACRHTGSASGNTTPPVSLPAGTRWTFKGFSSSEENEGQGATWSAGVDVATGSGTATFALTCFKSSRSIGLSMSGREGFEKLAKSAIEGGRGRFGSNDSYIDLVIGGQPFPLKANFFELTGELNFGDGYRANGRIVNGLLKSRSARMNGRRLKPAISLRNSANSICQVLRKCRVRQNYCRATGR